MKENILEKKNTLNEEVRTLKREHKIQAVRLCELTKLKKKDKEDKSHKSIQELMKGTIKYKILLKINWRLLIDCSLQLKSSIGRMW